MATRRRRTRPGHTPWAEVPPKPPPESRDAGQTSLVGIACVLGASSVFVCNDAVVKWLSDDHALHQIVLIRAIIALTLTLVVLVPLEGGYRNLLSRRWPLHLLRGFVLVVTNMAFFAGLSVLPLGEATAIFFVAPLLITALSALLLGEHVGVRRWSAVLIGLAGVLVMVRPGTDAFQVAALFPLCAAFTYALLQILTRKLGTTERASTMSVYIQVCFIGVGTAFGLVAGDGRFVDADASPQARFLLRAWTWPQAEDLALMLAIGVLGAAGSYLMSQAYRMSRAAVVAPFEYAALPLSVLLSIVVWGDWPDRVAWIGIALILAAGLYVFQREARLGRATAARGATRARAAPSAPRRGRRPGHP